jgi:cytochrome c553
MIGGHVVASRQLAVVGFLIATCRGPDEPVVVASRPDDAPKEAAAREPGPIERFALATTVHMPSHFADVVEIQSAIIRGSVMDAHRAARDLLATRGNVTIAEWAPYVFAMNEAAAAVDRAATLEDAGVRAAELVRTCGDCHSAVGASLATVVTDPPVGDDDAARMRRHRWAVARLFEGLVIPSDDAWVRGAEAFVELPACASEPSVERDAAAISWARETILAQEAAARTARTSVDRARVYGALLPTCAACHAAGC